MSHVILGTKFAQQDQRRAPWHEIQGATFAPRTTVTEGLALVAGDFLVERAPLYVYYEGRGIKVAGQSALMRPSLPEDPEVRFLGIVGDDYELLQHAQVAKLLDPLVERGWTLETLGILHEGAQFFATFFAGEFRVNEDDIKEYWVASEYKARSAFNLFSADTRVVCANTYRVAESQAIQRLNIPHYRGAGQELEFAVQVLALAEAHKAEFKAQLEQMGRTRLVEDQVREILRGTYLDAPQPRRAKFIDDLSLEGGFAHLGPEIQKEYTALQQAWLQERDVVERTREAAYERYDVFNQERPAYARTAWAVWNGVTEVENFKNGRGRATSVLFGNRATTMQRAYSLLLESMN